MEITKGEKVEKKWGWELIIHNSDKYCGKVLHFYKGAKFSVHFHLLKQESWLVAKGKFMFTWVNTENAKWVLEELNEGDVVTLYQGIPHSLEALVESEIFEVSTTHFDSDSYRIAAGDSQKQ